MISCNSISGGQTSAYIAANYPANYNLFSLVTTNDKKCIYPDPGIRQFVSDKIGKEFIGTLEDDKIIRTIIELEQFIGTPVTWVSGITFDEVVQTKGGWLPNKLHRYCTVEMKLRPMFEWWRSLNIDPLQMRIGFRANEVSRAVKMNERMNANGLIEMEAIVGHSKNGRNKWANIPWQAPTFPLIYDQIFKDDIVNFWKDKPVEFAFMNNCVGCFHRNEILLRKMFDWQPNKMQWFADQEKGRKRGTWKSDITYEKIKSHGLQFELFESDFSDCDSGYCGI